MRGVWGSLQGAGCRWLRKREARRAPCRCTRGAGALRVPCPARVCPRAHLPACPPAPARSRSPTSSRRRSAATIRRRWRRRCRARWTGWRRTRCAGAPGPGVECCALWGGGRGAGLHGWRRSRCAGFAAVAGARRVGVASHSTVSGCAAQPCGEPPVRRVAAPRRTPTDPALPLARCLCRCRRTRRRRTTRRSSRRCRTCAAPSCPRWVGAWGGWGG